MLDKLKKPLIPAVLIILLLALYFTRWDKEVSLKPTGATQTIYQTDRWNGQRWMITYGATVVETPIIEQSILLSYAKTVKSRPDVIALREEKISDLNNYKKARNSYNDSSELKAMLKSLNDNGFMSTENLPETKSVFETVIEEIDTEIQNLAMATAQLDLGNRAWVKRNVYARIWDGLMVISVLWLITTLFFKKPLKDKN